MKKLFAALCAVVFLMAGCKDKPDTPAPRQTGFVNPNIYTTDFDVLYTSIIDEMGVDDKRIAPAFYVFHNTFDVGFSQDGTITSFSLILMAEEDQAEWDYIMGYYFIDAIVDENGINGFEITPNDKFSRQNFAKGTFAFDFNFVPNTFKLLNSPLFASALEQYKVGTPSKYRILSDHVRQSDLSEDAQIIFLNCNVDSGYQQFETSFEKTLEDDPYLLFASGDNYLAVLQYENEQDSAANGCIIFVL